MTVGACAALALGFNGDGATALEIALAMGEANVLSETEQNDLIQLQQSLSLDDRVHLLQTAREGLAPLLAVS